MNMPAQTVLIAPPVAEQIRQLNSAEPGQAAEVLEAIGRIPYGGRRLALSVPGDPAGTEYWTIRPASDDVPVPVFRRALKEETKGRFVVVALFPPAAYELYEQNPERRILGTTASVTVSAGDVGVEVDGRRVR
jgi:hypothetical protein